MDHRRFWLFPGLALAASLCPAPGGSQTPLAAPGLLVPAGALSFALDYMEGKPELVPVHHSSIEINPHKGANVAGFIAGLFFYKPKMIMEVAGSHAKTTLHDLTPFFYIHMLENTDSAGHTAKSEDPVFGLV